MSLMRQIAVLPATTIILAATLGLNPIGQDGAADPPPNKAGERGNTPMDELRIYVDELLVELTQTRQEVATLQLQNQALLAERNELQQFITDHDQLGRDFEQYHAIREIAEREARQREIERRQSEYRQKVEAQKAERAKRRAEAQSQRAIDDRLRDLDVAGFSHIGLDIFSGRMAFHYKSTDSTQSRVEYDPAIGHYPRIYRSSNIDFTEMTLSGSILNASNNVKNLGVAIVFFDENNNQVGHETVQVNNARPDVPYPFTATINMALNRPFVSSSVYVLYADDIAPGG